jgi:sulfite reductase (ferredoxin)
MSDNGPSKVEGIKEASRQLRGGIAETLKDTAVDHFNDDDVQLIKFHGFYQQDNRDQRKGGKQYSFMVRSRIPGGKLTAAQFLTELEIADRWANGTLRITDRQAFQLHGVLKSDLRDTIRGINECKLSTISACGDVCRNVMCCPAPIKSAVRDQLQADAQAMADFVRPKTTAYYEIWLKDGEDSQLVHEELVEEPLYGNLYLPRKFKIGFTLPEDNCIDVYSQDLGFLAVVEGDRIVGYNVLVGGSMGMTPARKDTFPAVAKRLTYVPADRILAIAEAVIKVQRDFGNRSDRKLARMKYLIANWGLEVFKAKVEEYYGSSLPEPHPTEVTDVDDHLGWHEQGDGKLFLGVNVENGRIKDEGNLQLKTGLRAILQKYPVDCRLTALQSFILCDLEPAWRDDINSLLRQYGFTPADELTLARRYSISCPALPTCGLAVTEAERVMPHVMDQIEAALASQGLRNERIGVHMTGCPNGCARPYSPDIGLVGKARGKYTLYLGGNVQCVRIAFLYEDMVPEEELGARLTPLFAYFKRERLPGEAFGDFCWRVGKEALQAAAASA